MTDKRATTCWVALDESTLKNGCMWFVPGSHKEKELRPHRTASEKSHVLCTDFCCEEEGKPEPLQAGSCTFHHGRTLHYSRGNETMKPRRTYITNYRPNEMVKWERENGFDHLRTGLSNHDPSKAGDVYKGKLDTIRQTKKKN
jgi:ectoine hydroxylase-related dioxygenase (phytanoyl-CoA dioxygenase family)